MSASAHLLPGDALAQVGACGLFLLQVLGAVPKSLRYFRARPSARSGSSVMSLVIIMTCGLFVGAVLGLQLYDVLSRFGASAMSGTVVVRYAVPRTRPGRDGVVVRRTGGIADHR